MSEERAYRPIVAVQKRHNKRLFGRDAQNQLVSVCPGVVVDTDVVDPLGFEMYLNSHAAIQVRAALHGREGGAISGLLASAALCRVGHRQADQLSCAAGRERLEQRRPATLPLPPEGSFFPE